jgi:putative salt-induced outer membrane protein
MTKPYLGILSVFAASVSLSSLAIAQAPGAPTPLYTGNVGGGLAVTRGNTETNNFNLTAALTRDPKTKNVIKGNAAYLRSSQSAILNLDRTSVNLRDEYGLSLRTFAFGQLDYFRDNFKQIIFFWAPTGGIGYKLINTDATQFIVDGGVGTVFEKNPGIETSKSGSLVAGERFNHRLSQTATFSESLSTIWKMKDFQDSLTNFSFGVTSTLVGNLQLKLEFLDSYKHKSAKPSIKKNDTAFVTSFVLKY